jgi:AP2-associated kinase
MCTGGFARVYQGHLQQSPDYKVAVKHIHTSPEPSSYEPVLGEIELMKTFHHKNIVQLIDSSVQRKQEGGYEIFICMEFCAGGQVVDLMNMRLTQNRRFTEAEVLKIFSDVVEAVAHLHYQQPPVV